MNLLPKRPWDLQEKSLLFLCQMRIVLNYLLVTYYYTHRVRSFFLFVIDKNEQTVPQVFKKYNMRTVECAGRPKRDIDAKSSSPLSSPNTQR